MPGISLQFYALPQELKEFVHRIMQEFHLHAVAMRYFPFDAISVDDSQIDAIFADGSAYRRWAFTLDAPMLPVANELDHTDKNPTHLRLDVGQLTSDGLEESWLSCGPDDKRSFDVWKKIAKLLREISFAGITATDRRSGKSAEYRTQRYTAAAKELERSGVTMIGSVGPNRGPLIRLGMLADQES